MHQDPADATNGNVSALSRREADLLLLEAAAQHVRSTGSAPSQSADTQKQRMELKNEKLR
jgi:hypothetical protein